MFLKQVLYLEFFPPSFLFSFSFLTSMQSTVQLHLRNLLGKQKTSHVWVLIFSCWYLNVWNRLGLTQKNSHAWALIFAYWYLYVWNRLGLMQWGQIMVFLCKWKCRQRDKRERRSEGSRTSKKREKKSKVKHLATFECKQAHLS